MESLNFKTGFKTYDINGDESKLITINTSDFGIFERAKQSEQILNDLKSEYNNAEGKNFVVIAKELNKKVRAQIDYIFGSEVCDTAFGNVNCFSLVDGVPMFTHFVSALLEKISADMTSEQKKMKANINKYVSRVKK